VRELDGIASTAFEPMGQGQMAVCIDPTGGQFDIWEPSNGPRTGVDSSLHGAPSWFELTTGDIDRAAAFYSGLFGWTPEFLPVPGSKCAVFKLGELRVAGLLSLTPHMLSQRSRWETFFTVRDVDQAARDALDLGATLSEPVLEVAGIGRFCGITSPQGLAFHLIAHAR
jgi:predicted enzyme related to lactoylglutathione lyase